MCCSMASVTVCSGICSRSRMRRRAFWRELADTTTSHQFFVACTGFWWSSGSTTSWPLSSRRCEVKFHRTWSMTTSWSRTPDTPPSLRSRHVLTVPRTNTRLGDRSFSVADPKIWNSLPASMWQPDIEFGHFKRLLKAFQFGLHGTETLAFLGESRPLGPFTRSLLSYHKMVVLWLLFYGHILSW